MTITFAIALTAVLVLSSVYLIWQWHTGELRDAVDDDDHECYDEGDEAGYVRGREDEKVEATDPLNETLGVIVDLFPGSYRQSQMDEGDWQAVAEEMYEKAAAAL